MSSVVDEVIAKCEHCGGAVPCKSCSRAERPGVRRSGERAEVVLPVGADKGRVEAMLRARNMDPDEWIIDRLKVNEWEGFYVQRDGTEKIVPLQQTTAFLSWVRPPEVTEWGRFLEGLERISAHEPASPRRRLKPKPASASTWFVHGDDQAPFINEPFQLLTLEALRDIQPTKVLYTGDGPDFPDISRHKSKEGTRFHADLVECMDSLHAVLADRIDAAGGFPDGKHYVLGNHDIRLDTFLRDKAPQLFQIRKARSEADPEPSRLLTVENLARLDELGFDVATDDRGDYPYGRVRIADELIGTHGWVAKRGAGASAQASIENLNSGIIVGHTHRCALTFVTRHTPEGELIPYTAAESGTMADPQGLGYSVHPDWQAGWLTVTVRSDGSHHVDVALYRDRTLRWRDRQWVLTARGVRAS